MLTKPLLLLALMAAASAADLDSVMEHITGTSDPTPSVTTPAPVYAKCKQPNGNQGECIPYYLCDFQSVSGNIHAHSQVEDCASYIDVCCTESEKVSVPIHEPKVSGVAIPNEQAD